MSGSAPSGVVTALADEEPERLARELERAGAESVAICLLFSYLDPTHEQRIAARLRERLPGVHVSASHEVLPRFREYERCSTTAIDAYLSPLLGRYLERLGEATGAAGLPAPLVMQSSGGVAPAAEAARAGAWSVLSGPAGGAVGAGLLARASGDGNALGFDMGGTSCDVCVVEDGAVRRTDSRHVDGRVIQLPMVDVHTVGAGGGSIGWRDAGGALRVGPRSAGAEPGPACYGRGGTEPTVTDANLLLGHLAGDSRLAGGVALDVAAAEAAVDRLGASLGLDRIETAAGIVRVANQEMVRALRVVTVERGIDPRGFALLPFGGAGPMHAAAIAAELGIGTILCPRAGGVLSALGLCASDRRRDTARTVMLSGAVLSAERIAAEVATMIAGAGADLEGATPELTYEMRYAGQAFELPVPGPAEPDPADLAERFEARARGALRPPRPRRRGRPRRHPPGPGRPRPGAAAASRRGGAPDGGSRPVRFGGEWVETPVLRGEPAAGTEADGAGRLRAARGDAGPAARLGGERRRARHDRGADGPDNLQVLIGGLRAACDEMGAALIRSAYSANIKERHDCSTALFDAGGELVMQAEHIPVHLGSMPDAVAAVLGERHQPGVAWILNDPYRGGTHLPDITLVSPVFVAGELFGFAACRAHHADVGGPTPGEHAGLLEDPRRRGRSDPADDRHRGRAGAARRTDAGTAPAARRPARAAGRQPDRRAAARRARRAPRRRTAAGRDGGDPRLLRAPHPRRPRRAPRRHLQRRGRARRRLGRRRARHRPPRHRDDRRREPAARLQRHRAAGRGQPQLPALGDQVGGVLRRPRLDRPRGSALAPAPTARSRSSPPPAACSTPSSRPRSRPATSRPRAASPTS